MIRTFGWRSVVGSVLAAFALGWLMSPDKLPSPALVRASSSEWRVADLPRRGNQTSVAVQVAASALWGAAEAAVKSEQAVDARWRVAAIYRVGNDQGALISFSANDRPARLVRVGDTLPSGHRVMAIQPNGVCVQIDGRSYRLGVERNE